MDPKLSSDRKKPTHMAAQLKDLLPAATHQVNNEPETQENKL